ncbi:MAG: hypothetical protein L4877_01570 [Aigarchaeota archaeon]|nr:hypothetical protein [Candidatus Geocrenenecus dongiae]
MDGLLEDILNVFSSPLLIFIFVVAALALSLVAIVFLIVFTKKVSSLVSSISSQPPQPAPTQKTAKPSVSVSRPSTEVVKVVGGLGSLEEVSSVLNVNSIFLFNLAGMSIESYNVKEEDKLAASLADLVTTLRKNGFPTDVISIRDGIQGFILAVTKVGEMEVYALLITGVDVSVDVDEAREMLREYVQSLIKGGGA